jgi:glutamine synthetase adenylyltransferase
MFELMKSNRSYVLWSLGEKDLKKLREFKDLREHLRIFIKRAMETQNEDNMQMLRSNSIAELFWIQFLSILKYWTQDRSPAFEKTDVLIEKSSAVFNDLTQANPLNHLVDLGKFIGKEFVL